MAEAGAGDGVAPAEAAGEAAPLADGDGLAAGRARARRASSCGPPLRPALPAAWAEALGVAEALGAVLAEALGATLGTGVGLAGAGAAAAAVFGAASSTWRNCSSAVWLTRLTTCCALWPGTETLMMSLPCCWTWASVVPLAFTRFSMIWMACCMSAAVGGTAAGLDRPQLHGGPAGQVQAQVHPEVLGPAPRAGQIAAQDGQQQHHDERGQHGQRPARP